MLPPPETNQVTILEAQYVNQSLSRVLLPTSFLLHAFLYLALPRSGSLSLTHTSEPIRIVSFSSWSVHTMCFSCTGWPWGQAVHLAAPPTREEHIFLDGNYDFYPDTRTVSEESSLLPSNLVSSPTSHDQDILTSTSSPSPCDFYPLYNLEQIHPKVVARSIHQAKSGHQRWRTTRNPTTTTPHLSEAS